MGAWVFSYAIGALAYAALAMLGLLALSHLFGWRVATKSLPVFYMTLIFVFMTQHPFPDANALICPVPGTASVVSPFSYWVVVEELWTRGAPVADWLADRTIASTVMNLVVCAAIGVAGGLAGLRPPVALAFGVILTLIVELTQLTGIWGLYPCAYRQFSVDDLLLNALGVFLGAVGWKIYRPQAPDA